MYATNIPTMIIPRIYEKLEDGGGSHKNTHVEGDNAKEDSAHRLPDVTAGTFGLSSSTMKTMALA